MRRSWGDGFGNDLDLLAGETCQNLTFYISVQFVVYWLYSRKNKKYYIKYFVYINSHHEVNMMICRDPEHQPSFLTTTASCPLSRRSPHLLNSRTRNTQRKETMTTFVPDHHFLKPGSLTLICQRQEGASGAGKSSSLPVVVQGSPPPQPQTTLHTVCRGEFLTYNSCEGDL